MVVMVAIATQFDKLALAGGAGGWAGVAIAPACWWCMVSGAEVFWLW